MNNCNGACECANQKCGVTTVGYFPEQISLGVAYIPFQQWSEDCLYTPDVALMRGSLFKELDKSWKGGCC